MDETIGVKGGKQDRRRTIKITKARKKKLEELEELEDIKELEKKVRKKQIYTIIKALPIALGGGFVKTIHDTAVGKHKKDKEEENSKWRIKEYDGDISPKTPVEAEMEQIRKQKKKEITTPTGEKIIIYFTNTPEHKKEKSEAPNDERIIIDKDRASEEEKKKQEQKTILHIGTNKLNDSEQTSTLTQNKEESSANDSNVIEQDKKVQEKINSLKSRRIIEEYDRQLKEIRYELRNAIFEFNILVHEESEIIQKKEAEKILDNLSNLIEKIEIIKNKMNIDNYSQYDENYIYFLIETYFEDFKNKQIVKEIKESPFYIELSEKISELDSKKNSFKKKVEEKKEALDNKEEQFSKLKNKYLSLDKINSELVKFQIEQEKYLKDIQEKIENSKTITEKVEYEFQALNHQSNRMLRFMSFQIFLPGPMIARVMAASTLSHINFINNIIRPQFIEKKYKVITVTDYSSEIKNSIDEIDNSVSLLGKTSKQIDKLISEINTNYKDYLGVVKECDEMLSNLNKMKNNLREKEFEMKKLKRKQQKELEKNDAKVLTRGKYPVN